MCVVGEIEISQTHNIVKLWDAFLLLICFLHMVNFFFKFLFYACGNIVFKW